MPSERSYCQIVVEKTNATQEQVAEALKAAEERREHVGRVLVAMQAITEKERVMCLAESWGIPFADLAALNVAPELVHSISEALMRKHKCFPIGRNGKRVTLAMVTPNDIFSVDDIRVTTGYEIEPVLAIEEDILTAIERVAWDRALSDVLHQFGKADTGAEALVERGGEPAEAPLISKPALDGATLVSVMAASRVASRGAFNPEDKVHRSRVNCTVFAPSAAACNDVVAVQVFAHMPEQTEESDADAQEGGVTALGTRIARGSKLTFELGVAGLRVYDPAKELVWGGAPESVQFVGRVPADARPHTVIGKLLVSQDTVPIGQIRFKLKVVGRAPVADRTASPQGETAHRYEKAFISYASEDRDEVHRRVQMLEAVGIRWSQDVLNLSPAERWEQALYRQIDQSDVMFLFWSVAAKESTWVTREWRYALAHKGAEFITPVPVGGHPMPTLPAELAHLHLREEGRYFVPDAARAGQFWATVSEANRPPEISSSAPTSGSEGSLYGYDVQASDPDGDALTYSLTTSPAGMTIDPTTGAIQWTPGHDQTGDHLVEVLVADGKGGSDTQSWTITVGEANRPPEISSSAPASGSEGSLYGYDVQASDPDGDALTYSLTTSPAGMTIDSATGLTQWTPDYDQAGEHPVEVLVEDGKGGRDTQSWTINVTDTNRAPEITSAAPTSGSEADPYTYDVEATDPDGDTLTYRLTTSPAGMTIGSAAGLIAWTPDYGQAGDHAVEVLVEDGKGGRDTQSWTITVGETNRAPEITSAAPTSGSEGDPYTYHLEASDPDGDTLSYSLTISPAGMTIDRATGLIQWTPDYDQAGDHPVEVLVEDGRGGSDTQSWTIAVTDTNRAPEITSAAPTSGSEGDPYTYHLEASDPDGDTLTYSLTISPAGMTIDRATGLIEWTPGHDQTGDHLVEVLVEDGKGGTDTRSWTITVRENHAPECSDIKVPRLVEVNSSIGASAEFADPDAGDTHRGEWDWGDGSASSGTITEADGGVGVVSGSHSYAAPGVYAVGLTVTDQAGISDQCVFQDVVVHDPGSGFVTGGGGIESPPGAYGADPVLTGEATFGLVAKYEKGKPGPGGEIELRFHMADLNFHSSEYDWRVVAGHKAKYKGSGTINGRGDYGFMLTAIEGDLIAGGGADQFRIRIWDKTASDSLVYDSQMGEAQNSDAASQVVGGSIVIRTQGKE
jgi:hypothetical protein